jgi:hypothetical protein
MARSESEGEWEVFLTDLTNRGFSTEDLEIIVVDGGRGLLKALPTVFPNIPIQRCWAHKIRNLTDKVRRADQCAVKNDLRRIYDAASEKKARQMARRFAAKWQRRYPQVVRSLRDDLDELLAFFIFKDPTWRKWTRTTNAIERRFREVRRRTRPMGVDQHGPHPLRGLHPRKPAAEGINPLPRDTKVVTSPRSAPWSSSQSRTMDCRPVGFFAHREWLGDRPPTPSQNRCSRSARSGHECQGVSPCRAGSPWS